MMPWPGPGGMMNWMPVMPLVGMSMMVLIALVLLVMSRRMLRARHDVLPMPPRTVRTDPEAQRLALRERYASGEIDLATFEHAMADSYHLDN